MNGITILRLVLSRYLEADLGADVESDLRTKTDQKGPKSVSFNILDRMIPTFLRIWVIGCSSSIIATH